MHQFENLAAPIDSHSVGNATHFLSLVELNSLWAAMPPAPRECGSVALLISRGENGRRSLLSQTHLSAAQGMPGDAWARQAAPDPMAQLATIQKNVVELLANGQRWELSGDNLVLDLDLSAGNLPAGSQLKCGSALLEVTTLPHTGCGKFRARFGPQALQFVSQPQYRLQNLRGIYLRVVVAGDVRLGDAVTVERRPPAAD